MNFFDSHAHLTDENAFEDLDEVILRAKKNSVLKIVNVCSSKSSLQKGILLNKKHGFIYVAASSTPHDVKENDDFFQDVEIAAKEKKLVAIGETGLDYHYAFLEKAYQIKFFENYLDLAKRYSLPVIIHVRKAFSDLFSITDHLYKDVNAVIHCFTGDINEAKQALDRNWYISLSGIITFKNSSDLREVVKYIPLDKLLVETDCPLLAPVPFRGKKNEPAYIKFTIQKLSEIKNLSLEEAANLTYKNACNFFNIK